MNQVKTETLTHIILEVEPNLYDQIFNGNRQVDFIPVEVITDHWGFYINESRGYSNLEPIDWSILDGFDLVTFKEIVQK